MNQDSEFMNGPNGYPERFNKNLMMIINSILIDFDKLDDGCPGSPSEKYLDSTKRTLLTAFIKNNRSSMLIDSFIRKGYPDAWEAIKKRDTSFFLEKSVTWLEEFKIVNPNLLKNVFQDNILSPETIEIIWKYLTMLIKISVKYMHRCSQPIDQKNGDYRYRSPFKIDLKDGMGGTKTPDLNFLIKRWEIVKLD